MKGCEDLRFGIKPIPIGNLHICVERLQKSLRIPDVCSLRPFFYYTNSWPGPLHKDVSCAAATGLSRNIEPHQFVLDLVFFEPVAEVFGAGFATT